MVSDSCSAIFCSCCGSPSALCRWGRVTDAKLSPAGLHAARSGLRGSRRAPGLYCSHRQCALACYFLLNASLPCPVLFCAGFDLLVVLTCGLKNSGAVVKSHRLWSQTDLGPLGCSAVGWCGDWSGDASVRLASQKCRNEGIGLGETTLNDTMYQN